MIIKVRGQYNISDLKITSSENILTILSLSLLINSIVVEIIVHHFALPNPTPLMLIVSASGKGKSAVMKH